LEYYKLIKISSETDDKRKQTINKRTNLQEDIFKFLQQSILVYSKYEITAKNVKTLNTILENLKDIADKYIDNIKSNNDYIRDYYYTQGIYIFHMLLYIAVIYIKTGEHKYIFYNTMFNVINTFRNLLNDNNIIESESTRTSILESFPEKINLLFEDIKSQNIQKDHTFQLDYKYKDVYTKEDDLKFKSLETLETLYDFYYIKYNTHFKVGRYLTTSLFGKSFPDCGETFTRNLISIICINDKLEFNITLLQELGAKPELITFFQKFKSHKDIQIQNIPNSSMRAEWALLVSNMNVLDSNTQLTTIEYSHIKTKQINSNTNVEYCITGSADNFLAVINGLLPKLNMKKIEDLNGRYGIIVEKTQDRGVNSVNVFKLSKIINEEEYTFKIDMSGHPELKQINIKKSILSEEETTKINSLIESNEDNIFYKSLFNVLLLKKINTILDYTYAFYYSDIKRHVYSGKYSIYSYILNENIKEYYIYIKNVQFVGGNINIDINDLDLLIPESIYLVPFGDRENAIIKFNTKVDNINFFESPNGLISLNFEKYKGNLRTNTLPLSINELRLNGIPANIKDLEVKDLTINYDNADFCDVELSSNIKTLRLKTKCLPKNINKIGLDKLFIDITEQISYQYTLLESITLLSCKNFALPSNLLDLELLKTLDLNNYDQLKHYLTKDKEKYKNFIKHINLIFLHVQITPDDKKELETINPNINIIVM
jgi:hypothetical protein